MKHLNRVELLIHTIFIATLLKNLVIRILKTVPANGLINKTSTVK